MRRRHFIDNLRSFAVLALFLYHTAMIYNNFGENFYVRGPQSALAGGFIAALAPLYMPLLFVLAGMSAALALEKRSPAEFVKERLLRLGVPLVFGLLVLAPAQTYFAERFHNNYAGGYFEQYVLFFTKPTDLTGYTGGFTPAHLWFVAYLLVISLLAAPLVLLLRRRKAPPAFERLSLAGVLALFMVFMLTQVILDIGGKSLGEYFAQFMLGYLVLSKEPVLEKLEKNRMLLLALAAATTALNLYFTRRGWDSGIPYDIFVGFNGWVCILWLLGFGRRRLDFTSPALRYLARASYPVYLLHQAFLVAAAFYVFGWTKSPPLQALLIIALSAAASFAAYELFRRFGPMRFLLGIKAPPKQKNA